MDRRVDKFKTRRYIYLQEFQKNKTCGTPIAPYFLQISKITKKRPFLSVERKVNTKHNITPQKYFVEKS